MILYIIMMMYGITLDYRVWLILGSKLVVCLINISLKIHESIQDVLLTQRDKTINLGTEDIQHSRFILRAVTA